MLNCQWCVSCSCRVQFRLDPGAPGYHPTPYSSGIPALCRVADAKEEKVWKTHLFLSTLNGEGHTLHLFTANRRTRHRVPS